MQHKIVLFGKGGIGKSTTTSNLAVVYAQMGLKVLVIGCDPKHDTTIYLTGGRQIPTVLENAAFLQGKPQAGSLLVKGTLGIDCVEAGGPEPGIGCAGRGITRMSEILKEAGVADDTSYDVILYDVLGDVVCGGFAAPLRQGFADKVIIVTSEELMSLYAANNIAKAVRNYSSNGISLIGLIANLRDPGCDEAAVSRFAEAIGTKVLQFLPRDPIVRQAEYQKKTVVETAPDSPLVAKIRELAQRLLDARAHPPCIPQPMTDEQFNERSRKGFPAEDRPRGGLAGVAVVAAEGPEGDCCAESPAAGGPLAAATAPPEPTSIFVSRSTAPVEAPAEPERRWRQFLFDAAVESPEDPAAKAALEAAWGRHRLELRGRAPKAEPGAVNLIGFPDDAASREWTGLLERAGLRVNARLLPGWEDAEKLRSAGIQVFFPNPKFQSLYRSMADFLPGRSALLAAPCGLDYSRRWLLHVAGLAGLEERAARVWEESRFEIHGRWEELRARASRERLAFVGDLDQLRGLAGPGGAGGVPLIPVLKEMGFALDFIVFAGGSTRISEKKAAAKNRLCWFSSEDELARLLEEGDFKAVYSEFPGDERVTKRGKTPFGPEFFEVGPQGAVRSLDRLLGACGWNFYLRYADYL